MEDNTIQTPDQEAALTEIAAKKADPTFMKEYLGGNPDARKLMSTLQERAFNPSEETAAPKEGTPEHARQKIVERKADPEFRKRYLSNDPAAREEMRALYDAANPENEVDPNRGAPSLEEYEGAFDVGPGLPPTSPENQKTISGWFRQLGLPVEVAGRIVREGTTRAALKPTPEKMQAEAVATERELRRKWGDEYDGRIGKIRGVLQKVEDPRFIQTLASSGLGNSRGLIESLWDMIERRGGA